MLWLLGFYDGLGTASVVTVASGPLEFTVLRCPDFTMPNQRLEYTAENANDATIEHP